MAGWQSPASRCSPSGCSARRRATAERGARSRASSSRRGCERSTRSGAPWLELFLDLVFVAAVAEVASTQHDPTHSVLLALFLRLPGRGRLAFYATKFDTDDLVYRPFTLLVSRWPRWRARPHVPRASPSLSCVRLVLLACYVRVYRDLPAAKGLVIFVFGTGVCIWLVSLAVPVPWKYVLWGAALLWRLLGNMPVDPRHLPERFGLLVLIVLGEAGVIGVVLGTAHVSWTLSSGTVAFGNLTGAAIWGLLRLPRRGVVHDAERARRITYTYAHYCVAAGISHGVGVKLTIVQPRGRATTTWAVRPPGGGALL